MTGKSQLPKELETLFWSYDFEKLDLDDNKKTIVMNIINYGNLDHWRWLKKNYGLTSVQEITRSLPKTAIRKQVRTLTGILFEIPEFVE